MYLWFKFEENRSSSSKVMVNCIFFQDGGGRHIGFLTSILASFEGGQNVHLLFKFEEIGEVVKKLQLIEYFPRWRRPPYWIFSTDSSTIWRGP